MLLLISAQSDSSPAHWHCSFSGAYHISLRLLPWILGWSCCLPPSFPLSCYTTSGLSFCHENAIITTPLVKPFQPLPSTFPLCSGYTTPTSPPPPSEVPRRAPSVLHTLSSSSPRPSSFEKTFPESIWTTHLCIPHSPCRNQNLNKFSPGDFVSFHFWDNILHILQP